MFANHRTRANAELRGDFGIEAQVLGITPDYRKRMHHDAFIELTVTADVRVRMDDAASGELRPCFDDGGWMHLWHGVANLSTQCATLTSHPQQPRVPCSSTHIVNC